MEVEDASAQLLLGQTLVGRPDGRFDGVGVLVEAFF